MAGLAETVGIGLSVLLGWTASTIGTAGIRRLILGGLIMGAIAHSGRTEVFTAWFYAFIVLSCFVYRFVYWVENILRKSMQKGGPGS